MFPDVNFIQDNDDEDVFMSQEKTSLQVTHSRLKSEQVMKMLSVNYFAEEC